MLNQFILSLNLDHIILVYLGFSNAFVCMCVFFFHTLSSKQAIRKMNKSYGKHLQWQGIF